MRWHSSHVASLPCFTHPLLLGPSLAAGLARSTASDSCSPCACPTGMSLIPGQTLTSIDNCKCNVANSYKNSASTPAVCTTCPGLTISASGMSLVDCACQGGLVLSTTPITSSSTCICPTGQNKKSSVTLTMSSTAATACCPLAPTCTGGEQQ